MAGEMNGFLKTKIRGNIISFEGTNLFLNLEGKEFIYTDFPKKIIRDFICYE